MDGAMMTLDWPSGRPSLPEVAQALNVRPSDLDSAFGVVLIDPRSNTYTVQCRTSACASAAEKPEVEGPFSNPGIGGFGPLRSQR